MSDSSLASIRPSQRVCWSSSASWNNIRRQTNWSVCCCIFCSPEQQTLMLWQSQVSIVGGRTSSFFSEQRKFSVEKISQKEDGASKSVHHAIPRNAMQLWRLDPFLGFQWFSRFLRTAAGFNQTLRYYRMAVWWQLFGGSSILSRQISCGHHLAVHGVSWSIAGWKHQAMLLRFHGQQTSRAREQICLAQRGEDVVLVDGPAECPVWIGWILLVDLLDDLVLSCTYFGLKSCLKQPAACHTSHSEFFSTYLILSQHDFKSIDSGQVFQLPITSRWRGRAAMLRRGMVSVFPYTIITCSILQHAV